MYLDVNFTIPPPASGFAKGEVVVMDFNGFSLKHFWNVAKNFSAAKLYLKYVQEVVPFRIHQNHFINCSPVLSKILVLVRPFIKKELFDVFHFHTGGLESLYELVPREILPIEYGGEAGKIDVIYEEIMRNIENHQEYLSDDSNWKLLH